MSEGSECKLLHVTNREEWRRWLAENAAVEREVWLVYNKVHTDLPRVAYDAAVEEALVVGWIDSTIRRLDDDRYAQKFTPRRPGSNWSVANRRRARMLLAAGRFTAAGRALLPADLEDLEAGSSNQGASTPAPAADPKLRWAGWVAPDWLLAAIAASPRAQAGYEALAPSYRRRYVGWVVDAKKLETRERRLRELLAYLANDEPMGIK